MGCGAYREELMRGFMARPRNRKMVLVSLGPVSKAVKASGEPEPSQDSLMTQGGSCPHWDQLGTIPVGLGVGNSGKERGSNKDSTLSFA